MGNNLNTRLNHTGDGQFYKQVAQSSSVPEVLPVYRTSVFAFDDVPSVDRIYEGEDDGYIYSRIKHPNTEAVSEILAAAEETEAALVFSSGMSAIALSILSVVQQGDHIISSPVLYGGMLSFNLRGGEQEASTVIRELSTIKYVPSLAGTATTLSYAAKTSHRFYPPQELAAVGITLGQLRLSVGLEEAEDIIAELDGALAKI
jgi:cystathionine beta-lyase/cystathionine gamma-synthase